MNFIVEALHSLRPGAQWALNGNTYDGLNWLDENQTKPTEDEIAQEIERLQSEYNVKEYQRLRAPEYPDLKELADALYWSSKGDNTKMDAYVAKCDAVKSKYPKPE
jgi:hypothetical protein